MSQTLASRIAARYLTAGASSFVDFGRGSDAKKAFQEITEEARHESGHGGYSGTIAEKSNFIIRRSTPMSRQDAQAFVDTDMEQADKWGPAFAVPISESKVKSEKEVTLKVQAKDSNSAIEEFKRQIVEKAKGKVELGYPKAVKTKSGGLPEMESFPASDRQFEIVESLPNGNFSHSVIARGASKKEAVDDLKAKFLKDDYFTSRVQAGTKFYLREVKMISGLVVKAPASKLPTWEVTDKVKIVDVGTAVIGWLFYGYASS